MCLELIGSRLFAPYLGTSIFVWTSLIGIILGALSLGYWWGGRLSDDKPEPAVLSRIILFAAAWTAALAFTNEFAIVTIQIFVPQVQLWTIVATIVLFGVPSVLLGMVLPYAVRLKMTTVQHSGETVGGLSALSTLGSIAGTFFTGFFLLSFLNTVACVLFVAFLLLAASFLAAPLSWRGVKLVLAALLVAGFTQADSFAAYVKGPGFVDVNTRYNRVWIYDVQGRSPYRMMQINESFDSAMYLTTDRLANRYTQFYDLGRHFKPDFKHALMIGGAGYSYPKEYLKKYAPATIDVVEIDPEITELARKYFGLVDDPRLRIIHEDARTYLNRTKEEYDLIFGDAYKSGSVPFQLTTVEAARKMHGALSSDGVVVLNLISSIEGENGRFLRAEVATFKTVFPHVLVYPTDRLEDAAGIQNVMLVALKSPAKPKLYGKDAELNELLFNVWLKEIAPSDVLTDSFAPVDRYLFALYPHLARRANPFRQKIENFLKPPKKSEPVKRILPAELKSSKAPKES